MWPEYERKPHEAQELSFADIAKFDNVIFPTMTAPVQGVSTSYQSSFNRADVCRYLAPYPDPPVPLPPLVRRLADLAELSYRVRGIDLEVDQWPGAVAAWFGRVISAVAKDLREIDAELAPYPCAAAIDTRASLSAPCSFPLPPDVGSSAAPAPAPSGLFGASAAPAPAAVPSQRVSEWLAKCLASRLVDPPYKSVISRRLRIEHLLAPSAPLQLAAARAADARVADPLYLSLDSATRMPPPGAPTSASSVRSDEFAASFRRHVRAAIPALATASSAAGGAFAMLDAPTATAGPSRLPMPSGGLLLLHILHAVISGAVAPTCDGTYNWLERTYDPPPGGLATVAASPTGRLLICHRLLPPDPSNASAAPESYFYVVLRSERTAAYSTGACTQTFGSRHHIPDDVMRGINIGLPRLPIGDEVILTRPGRSSVLEAVGVYVHLLHKEFGGCVDGVPCDSVLLHNLVRRCVLHVCCASICLHLHSESFSSCGGDELSQFLLLCSLCLCLF